MHVCPLLLTNAFEMEMPFDNRDGGLDKYQSAQRKTMGRVGNNQYFLVADMAERCLQ